MSRIKEGDICLFDKNNTLNLKDSVSFLTVKVLKKISRRTLFRSAIYACQVTGEPEIVSIGENLLYPLATESYDKNIIIRYPKNLPEFTEDDINLLDNVIKSIEESALANREELSKSLQKIKIKLDFYSLMH